MPYTIMMPQLGETVAEGTILAWLKQVGDSIDVDDIVVEISTDKVDTEVPSLVAGILVEILVDVGQTVDLGTPIAILDAEDPDFNSEHDSAEDAGEPSAGARAPVANNDLQHVLSPVVRKLAAEAEVDLADVVGSGRDGRITRKDITTFIEHQADHSVSEERAEPAQVSRLPRGGSEPDGPTDGVREIGRLRSVIARNMVSAKQRAAHVWTSVEVDYESVAQVRSRRGLGFKEAEGHSLTYLPFIARATIEALSVFPVVNSRFDLDAGTHTFNRGVHLGIAVDLDQRGLVVANIRDADSMTLKGLARSIRSAAAGARSGSLGPDDMAGFTFSISNPGPYGSFMTAPIIPVPNAAILSTDTVTKRPVVLEVDDGPDSIAIHHVGYLGLTWDHRVFDGSTAVLFLQRIRHNIETWDWDQELF